MIQFLNKKLLTEQLHKKTAIICALADIMAILYIKIYWLEIKLTPMIEKILILRGFNPARINKGMLEQMQQLMTQNVLLMFGLFLLWHFIIYIFVYRGSKKALKYVKRYCLITLILSILELLYLVSDINPWSLFALLIAFFYALGYLSSKKRWELLN
ncbi:MAG: hypothetical protein N4A33_04140 [Bacteriovoracaceae bacterium]|jgi:hypothetical protein|nr:hypothetical protein [Bacteriovoracaceae bacterium]